MSTDSDETGYDDSSELQPTVDFDYDAVEKNTDGVIGTEDEESEYDNLSAKEWMIAWKGIGNVVKWIYQRNSRNFQGIGIRAIIVCWIWQPGLHELTLTQLAGRFGMYKQSFGRWVVDWKKHFPSVVTAHMQAEIESVEKDGTEEEE